MTRVFLSLVKIVSQAITIATTLPLFALAEPQHGLAMYGQPALEAGFSALPYVNQDAPKGGKMVLAESGSFDSLNPYILKGAAPWGVRAHTVESLMGRNWDEPFTLYGLLAQSIETPPDRSWVEFTLRPEARFSNGDPVTAIDVLWSFETLGTQGHPRYINSWKKVAKGEITGPRSVRFTFNAPDRELPLILGLRPILRKADWDGRDFKESGLTPVTGSGPYILDGFEPGRFVRFKRDPNYWGRDLGFNAGRNNIDALQYDYYTDRSVIFEAFKAGEISVYREVNIQRWTNNYTFPAISDGRIVTTEVPHKRPSGMKGFVMNTRRDIFADWRVRSALIHAFDFEVINRTLNGGSLPRITSYFSNSTLAMGQGPATGRVAELLAPFADDLPEGALTGYTLPKTDGSGRNRRNLRKAIKLLADAGWTIQGGVLKNAQGQPFTFEILLKSSVKDHEAIANIYLDALTRLGITPVVNQVDTVQHRERLNDYDFDMVYYFRPQSLSPGNEQMFYFGSDGVTTPGTRNYMGLNSPAAEAMIAHMLQATEQAEFEAAVKAYDRILTAGRYVIPIWYEPTSNIAHDSTLTYPKNTAIYGDWQGFLPDVWWQK